MKIVFVNRFYAPDQSATSRMLTDLARALADEYPVHIVTSRLRSGDTATRFASFEIDGNIVVHRVWTTRFGRDHLAGRTLDYATFCVTAWVTLIRLVRREDLVVAKTDPPLITVPASWAARLRGARLVNWIQDLFPEVASGLGVAVARGRIGRVLGRLRDGSLRGAAANVVIGKRMSERVAALGVDARRTVVIPNWADGSVLKPATDGASPPRDTWGLAHICLQALVVLGLGYLAARWSQLGRGWQVMLVAGAIVDFFLGIALHFAVQDYALDRWFSPNRPFLETLLSYSLASRMNVASKLTHHLAFFRDEFMLPAALVLALLAGILTLAVTRAVRRPD